MVEGTVIPRPIIADNTDLKTAYFMKIQGILSQNKNKTKTNKPKYCKWQTVFTILCTDLS